MARSVREPIQVYLTSQERDLLDRCAAELGVSRSEVLRRGLRAVGDPEGAATAAAERQGVLEPPSAGPGTPPPSLPVAPLGELLDELRRDREGR